LKYQARACPPVLDSLRDSLRAAVKRVVKSSGIDEELVGELCHDVQSALLRSDVNVAQVQKVSQNLKKRALEESPPPGLSRKDHVVKILYSELAGLMGTEPEFQMKVGATNRIVMLGIQGSGKTTATAKLAHHLSSQGHSVAAIGADTFRPGALEQLKTMCEKSNVEVYGGGGEPDEVVSAGLRHFERQSPDVVLIDTAGRHKEEKGLLEEMKRIGRAAEPDLALLVIDGTIGQQCEGQARAFHAAVPVGGIMVTKLDSSANGGGAIAASAATGARIMYVGTGERIGDLESFSPTKFVGRLLGMGDVQAVLDLARRLENEAGETRMRRIASGKMNMDDFLFQLEEVSKSGSLRGMLEGIPGFAGKAGDLDKLEGKTETWRHIIQSMTPQERGDPDLLNASRIKRIARGSGRTEHDVKDLRKGYNNSKQMAKMVRGRQGQSMLRRMGLG